MNRYPQGPYHYFSGEAPDPVIFGLPDPVLFSTDPTGNNECIYILYVSIYLNLNHTSLYLFLFVFSISN